MGKRQWPWKDGKLWGFDAGDDGGTPSYIIETHRRSDIGRVEGTIAEFLPRGWRLRPLFDDAADEPIGDDFNLSCFWRLDLPGPPFRMWTESPYDLGYELQERANARSIEPDLPSGVFYPAGTSGDLRCNEPDDKEPEDRAWALRSIYAPEAWALVPGRGAVDDEPVLIGQPDTGVAGHDELFDCLDLSRAANFVEGGTDPTDPLDPNFPPFSPGHGTATASVVASRGTVINFAPPASYGTGAPGLVTGSAPGAKVVPIRAIRSVMRVTQGSVARAIEHARRKGCDVVSMSLGGLPLRALEAAVARAVVDQLIVVAAAGNCVRIVVYPARYRSVICVGGTNIDLVPWKGSSRGPRVDICAPAEFVWRAYRRSPSDSTTEVKGGQGTSYATALTAGVAALWLEDRRRHGFRAPVQYSTLQEHFRECLKATATVPRVWDATRYGAGIVNAERLIRSACGRNPPQTQAVIQREHYGPHVDALRDELEHERRGDRWILRLLSRAMRLTGEEREFFGHELIALLNQEAWAGVVGPGGGRSAKALDLPVLSPSRRLADALEGIGGRT